MKMGGEYRLKLAKRLDSATVRALGLEENIALMSGNLSFEAERYVDVYLEFHNGRFNELNNLNNVALLGSLT